MLVILQPKFILLLTFSYLFLFQSGKAQKIENFEVESVPGKVILTYDLEAKEEGETYDIEIYSSLDGYKKPLSLVIGDVGEGITPGKGKLITWFAQEEIGTYDGTVTFELQANVVLPYISIASPALGASFKRGGTYQIKWSGGKGIRNLRLELYHNGLRTETINSVANNGTYNWNIPDNYKPGKNFQVRFTDADTGGSEAFSSRFRISRKVPLGLKAGVLAGVAAGAAIVIISGGDSSQDCPNCLPEPPGF